MCQLSRARFQYPGYHMPPYRIGHLEVEERWRGDFFVRKDPRCPLPGLAPISLTYDIPIVYSGKEARGSNRRPAPGGMQAVNTRASAGRMSENLLAR